MMHAEILAKAEAYRRGELSPEEKNWFSDHLKACSACLELVDKWPLDHLPREGMTGRVMTRLSQERDALAQNRALRFAPLAAGLAGVLLLLAAFWHPERRWLEEDKFFARFDHHGAAGGVKNDKENFYE